MLDFGKRIVIAIIAIVAISACVYFIVRAPEGLETPKVKIYFKDQAPEDSIVGASSDPPLELLRLGDHPPPYSRVVSPGEVFKIPIFMRVSDFLRDKTSISLEFRIAPRFWFELVEVTGGDFGTPSCENYYEWELQAGVRISVSFPPDLVENHEREEKLIAEVVLKFVGEEGTIWMNIDKVVLVDRNGTPTISEKDLKILHLEPTVKEIQLQRENGGWVTIWSGEKQMFLKPGDPAKFLDEAHIPEGTYVASRVAYSGFTVAFDANGDGDENDVLDIVRSYVVTENFRETNQYDLPHEVTEGQINALQLWGFPVDYCNDFAEGYFRAVWPGPWHYDGSVGEIVFDLRFGWEFVKLFGVHPHRVREDLSTNFIPNFPVSTVAVAAPSPWQKLPTILNVFPPEFPSLNPPIAFTAILTDANGNPLLGRDVTWSATAGSILPTSGWTSISPVPYTELGEMMALGPGQVCNDQTCWDRFIYTETEGGSPVTITASFAGDDWYEASSWSCTSTPPPPPKNTSLTVEPSSFTLGFENSITLTATLVDADGNPLEGKTISWGASIGAIEPISGMTDTSGQVPITYTAPAVGEESPVTITATFAGDNAYGSGRGSAAGIITPLPGVQLSRTTLTIEPSTFTLEFENSITLTATLADADGNPLEGKPLSWLVSAGTPSAGSGITDANGQVSVTYTAPAVDAETSVTITVSFAGDDWHGASDGSSAGTVTPPS